MNSSHKNIKYFALMVFVSVLIVAIRLYYISLEQVGLFFDEAQYWTWSKDIEMGYFSKPPAIAWLISITTGFCGDSGFCIRSGATILHFLTGFIIYLTANKLFNDSRTAFWSAIIYISLPGITAASIFISADTPLLFFWALSMYALVSALDYENESKMSCDKWWLFLGIFCGFGLLSKYTMLIFIPSVALYIWYTRYCRQYLFSINFIIFIVIAFLVFSPNLLWNYSNDFISFRHTNENVLSASSYFQPMKALEFIAAQIFIFSPILIVILLMCLLNIKELFKEDKTRLLICLTFPLLAVAIIISLLSGAQGHWAAPAYIPASILVSHLLLQNNKVFILKIALIIHLLIASIIYAHQAIIPTLNLDKNPLARLNMWNELAPYASKSLRKYNNVVLLSDERKIVATLMYNLKSKKGVPYPVIKWNSTKTVRDHYDMTTDMNQYTGRNFLLITRVENISHIKKYFLYSSKEKEIELYSKKFYIYYLEKFKGY